LTSGYNCQVPLVNLTKFTDKDFVNKRYALGKRISRIYYRRHPLLYLIHEYNKFMYRIKLLCSNPAFFFAKVLAKISAMIKD